MCVHNHVFFVVIWEEIVPLVGIPVEGVVEYELEVRSLLPHQFSHSPVEALEHIQVGVPPWFVDRLNRVERWVFAPLVEELIDGLDCEVDVGLVNGVVAASVPVAHPLPVSIGVRKVVLINPREWS